MKGDPADWPKSGSSEVAVGHFGSERFLATIEPWHGNTVVITGCAVADLNADKRPDVVCIGTATANLKWYENPRQPFTSPLARR